MQKANNIKTQKSLWYILMFLNWSLIGVFWWQGSGRAINFSSPDLAATTIIFGRLLGLMAAYMILLQFFFMGRMPFLERVFGLDRLSRIHHANGKWGLLFLILHPVLITLGYASASGISLWSQSINFINNYEHLLWAMIGSVLFIIVVFTSVTISRMKLRYELWYFVHLAVYVAIFLSFWHQIEIGEDLAGSRFFYTYWIVLYLAVFSSHLIFRFLRPIRNYYRHSFYISRVVRENYNTVSVYIGGRELNKFVIYPGQFMILRFLTKKLWWQAHPFSLSMIPDGRELRITIKELGDFTRQISNIKEGTKIVIDGPYGIFTEFFSVSPKILFIAGGIGITPVRSLMEQMAKHGRDIQLIYGNKTSEDIVFAGELESISRKYNVPITHILSDQADYTGERGYLDEEKLKRLAPDINSREVYLCGPGPMMNAVINVLVKLGVNISKVHYEKFSLG